MGIDQGIIIKKKNGRSGIKRPGDRRKEFFPRSFLITGTDLGMETVNPFDNDGLTIFVQDFV
jgi:hypothetical protein